VTDVLSDRGDDQVRAEPVADVVLDDDGRAHLALTGVRHEGHRKQHYVTAPEQRHVIHPNARPPR
jgi:hypothetical protein